MLLLFILRDRAIIFRCLRRLGIDLFFTAEMRRSRVCAEFSLRSLRYCFTLLFVSQSAQGRRKVRKVFSVFLSFAIPTSGFGAFTLGFAILTLGFGAFTLGFAILTSGFGP